MSEHENLRVQKEKTFESIKGKSKEWVTLRERARVRVKRVRVRRIGVTGTKKEQEQ